MSRKCIRNAIRGVHSRRNRLKLVRVVYWTYIGTRHQSIGLWESRFASFAVMSCKNTWLKNPFIPPEITGRGFVPQVKKGCVMAVHVYGACLHQDYIAKCPRKGESVLNPDLGTFGGCSGARCRLQILYNDSRSIVWKT